MLRYVRFDTFREIVESLLVAAMFKLSIQWLGFSVVCFMDCLAGKIMFRNIKFSFVIHYMFTFGIVYICTFHICAGERPLGDVPTVVWSNK